MFLAGKHSYKILIHFFTAVTAGHLPDLPLTVEHGVTDNNGGASGNSSSNGAGDGTGEASSNDRSSNNNNNREDDAGGDDAGGDDRTDRDIHYPEDNPPDPDPASNLPLQAEEELQPHM